ncbi:hypothetical protein CTEN210_15656 [Chaetoceros tenuissimus]|uniref:Uncharacterized protein n=1 Tax=Chaetoceros tenuissimus TaxID=426638 RepID=A0AAD3HD39_9STRA|nr:hypothetical protein CTEN210_15656 [Chaetoceros tenuissimus]
MGVLESIKLNSTSPLVKMISKHGDDELQCNRHSLDDVKSTSKVDKDNQDEMEIKIQLLGLTNGIILETTSKETKKIKSGKSNLVGNEPVFAVVTGFHEVQAKEKTVIASHIPSLPIELHTGTKRRGNKIGMMALWPADFDTSGPATSTTTFVRKMNSKTIESLRDVQTNETQTLMYTTESLTLNISLMRGKEMITVGTCTVHFTGTETNSMQANLPIKTSRYAIGKAKCQIQGKKMKKKYEKMKQKPMKAVSFKGDPHRSYRLDDDAILSILIQTSKVKDASKSHINANEIRRKSPLDDLIGKNISCMAYECLPISGLTQQQIMLDFMKSQESFVEDDESDAEESTESNENERLLGASLFKRMGLGGKCNAASEKNVTQEQVLQDLASTSKNYSNDDEDFEDEKIFSERVDCDVLVATSSEDTDDSSPQLMYTEMMSVSGFSNNVTFSYSQESDDPTNVFDVNIDPSTRKYLL